MATKDLLISLSFSLLLFTISGTSAAQTTTAETAETSPVSADPPPSPPTTTAESHEYVDAHNKARSEVGVGPITWSQTLANTSARMARYQQINSRCQFADLGGGGGRRSSYGANQMWASGASVTPREAVENWVKEKAFYDYAENKCKADHQCGVYTQVVWRKSVQLGCAQVACAKEEISLTICLYYPPGNIVGEKPY